MGKMFQPTHDKARGKIPEKYNLSSWMALAEGAACLGTALKSWGGAIEHMGGPIAKQCKVRIYRTALW